MNTKLCVLFVAAGAGPLAQAHNAVHEQQLMPLNQQTINFVRDLVFIGAIYASSDATQLRIKSSILPNEIYKSLLSSKRTTLDTNSGDFIVEARFASALAQSSVLDSDMPESVQDYLLLLKLKQQSEGLLKEETTLYRSNPFSRD